MSATALDYMQAAAGPSSAVAAVADLGSALVKVASPFIATLVKTTQQQMEDNLKEQYEIFAAAPDADQRQRLSDYVQRVFVACDEPTAPSLPGVPLDGVPVPDLFQLLTIANKYALLLKATQGVTGEVKSFQTPSPATNPQSPSVAPRP